MVLRRSRVFLLDEALGALLNQSGQLLQRSLLCIDHPAIVVRWLEQYPARATLAAAADEGIHLQEMRRDAGRALADFEVSHNPVQTDWAFAEQQVTVEPRRGLRNPKGCKELGHALNKTVAGFSGFFIFYIRHIPNILDMLCYNYT